MFFFSRFRLRSSLLKKWSALLLCLLFLVGTGIAVPPFSHAIADQPICTATLDATKPLPIQRQRLKTVPSQNGGTEPIEEISFVDVGIGDLFAVPPGSPLIVANPPYPYQYKQACWGDEHLEITAGPSPEQSMIIMPSLPNLQLPKFRAGKFWDRSRKLVVRAQLPTLTLGNDPLSDSTTFKPGETIDIRLIGLPNPPTTSKGDPSSNPPLDSKFQWSVVASPADSSPPVVPSSNSGKATKLTLPTTGNVNQIRINVDYDSNSVGSILFKKDQGEQTGWSYHRMPDSLSTPVYFYRNNLQVSSRWISRFWAIVAAVLAYLGISFSVYLFNTRTGEGLLGLTKWYKWKWVDWKRTLTYLNPVVMTAGPYGKASLSKLQLLWFTIIILSVLVYLLCLTGDLSDLPGSVLYLLGISAAGTVGAGVAFNNTNRLSFANWQWLNDQGWLSEDDQYGSDKAKSQQADNYGKQSRWRDLLLDEKGVVNVYKFQLLFTSLLVGVFLILSGGSNLRGFRLPENFPQLLGTSNLFYVLGRSFQPTGFNELDAKITTLITKETALKSSVSLSSTPTQRPALLDDYLIEAKLAAGMTKVTFSDLAHTKFDHNPPITDMELLPPWAQKYATDWLK